jgi:TetR/AcrR family transcriptional repressor of mexJK operon
MRPLRLDGLWFSFIGRTACSRKGNEQVISGDLEDLVPQENTKEDRTARIVAASFDVFSECSFQDATTGEIARRARVSKRDIYAHFPDKHSLLLAAMMKVLKAEEANLVETIARAQVLLSSRKKLEAIGLTLIAEVLSAKMSVITRHVTSESIDRPTIGTVYFENGPARRIKLISELLSSNILDSNAPTVDTVRAAEQYLALIAHQPLLTTLIGMQDMWDVATAQSHVERAVDCFLRAHPRLA